MCPASPTPGPHPWGWCGQESADNDIMSVPCITRDVIMLSGSSIVLHISSLYPADVGVFCNTFCFMICYTYVVYAPQQQKDCRHVVYTGG